MAARAEWGKNIHRQYTCIRFSSLSCLCSSLGSRRPSILPVPDMFTSSSFSISGNDEGEEGDESDDELDDDVPWRSPSEKIAYVYLSCRGFFCLELRFFFSIFLYESRSLVFILSPNFRSLSFTFFTFESLPHLYDWKRKHCETHANWVIRNHGQARHLFQFFFFISIQTFVSYSVFTCQIIFSHSHFFLFSMLSKSTRLSCRDGIERYFT